MTWYNYSRRKSRSQTSDNMDRWKSRGGKSQRRVREEKRREGEGEEEKEEKEKRKRREREEKEKRKRREKEKRKRREREEEEEKRKRREREEKEKRKRREREEKEKRREREREEKEKRKRRERVRRKSQKKESEERVRRKSQKKEHAGARQDRQVAIHFVFQIICGSRGSKSRLAKAAGAEPSGQMRDEKSHAVVARSTFGSNNVQNTSASDHFWKLRCRKSARHCGAKHVSKSKCPKHTNVRPLLKVEMSKKCTPLWREAYFQVKM